MLWTTRWNTGTTFIRLLIFTCFFTLLAAGCGSGKSQVAVDEYRCGDERYLAEKAEFNSFCFAGMEVVHQPDGITGIQTRMTIPAQWVAPAAHTEYGEYPVFWRDLKDGEFFSEHTRITVDEGTAFNFVEFGGVRLGVRSENVLGTGAEPTYFWQVIVTEKNWFDCEPRREQCPDRADGMSKVEPDILGWEGSFPVPKEEIGDTVELRIHAPHGAGKVMLSVSGPKTKFSREVVTDDPVVCDPAWCRAALGQVLTGTQGSAVGLSTFTETRIRDAHGEWDWYVEKSPLGSGEKCRPPKAGANICHAYRSAEPPFAEWLTPPVKPEYEGGVLATWCCVKKDS